MKAVKGTAARCLAWVGSQGTAGELLRVAPRKRPGSRLARAKHCGLARSALHHFGLGNDDVFHRNIPVHAARCGCDLFDLVDDFLAFDDTGEDTVPELLCSGRAVIEEIV